MRSNPTPLIPLKFEELLSADLFYIPPEIEKKSSLNFPLANIEKLRTFMATPDGIKYKVGVTDLVNKLKSWAIENNIPQISKTDEFLKKITETDFEDEGKAKIPDNLLYSEGIEILAEIIEHLDEPSIPLAIRKNLITTLISGLTECPPGIYTNIKSVYASLASDLPHQLMNIRDKIAREAVMEIRAQEFDISTQWELHEVNSVINLFANQLAVPMIIDGSAGEIKSEKDALWSMATQFSQNITEKLTAEAIIKYLSNNLLNDVMEIVASINSENMKQKIDLLNFKLSSFGEDDKFDPMEFLKLNEDAQIEGRIEIEGMKGSNEIELLIELSLLKRLESLKYFDLSNMRNINQDQFSIYIPNENSLQLAYVMQYGTRTPLISYLPQMDAEDIKKIITNVKGLADAIFYLPQDTRENLLEKLGPEHLKTIIKDPEDLLKFMSALPKSAYKNIFNYIGENFVIETNLPTNILVPDKYLKTQGVEVKPAPLIVTVKQGRASKVEIDQLKKNLNFIDLLPEDSEPFKNNVARLLEKISAWNLQGINFALSAMSPAQSRLLYEVMDKQSLLAKISNDSEVILFTKVLKGDNQLSFIELQGAEFINRMSNQPPLALELFLPLEPKNRELLLNSPDFDFISRLTPDINALSEFFKKVPNEELKNVLTLLGEKFITNIQTKGDLELMTADWSDKKKEFFYQTLHETRLDVTLVKNTMKNVLPPPLPPQFQQNKQPPPLPAQAQQSRQPPPLPTQAQQSRQPPPLPTQAQQSRQPPPLPAQAQQGRQPPPLPPQVQQGKQPPPLPTAIKAVTLPVTVKRQVGSVETIEIPYIHPKLNLAHLNTNGKLYTDAQITAVQSNPTITAFQGRITKKKLNEIFQNEIQSGALTEFKFSLERSGENYRAIYKGKDKSLGQGGFGSVKILQDLISGQTSEAIKVIKESDLKAIEDEKIGLETARQFKALHARPDKDNQYEFVMDLAKGSSIRSLLDKNLPPVVLVDMVIHVLEAARDLHAKGIIHRDIKPGNIHYDLITKTATMVDLGTALFTTPENIVNGVTHGDPIGTAGFMSPEALDGRFNERSEMFALAMTCTKILGLDFFRNVPVNKIPDEATRKALLAVLKSMIRPNDAVSLNTIPDHVNVIDAIKKIRAELLDTLALTNKIVYLNVEDYLKAAPNDKTAMLTALKSADEIWLLDDNETNKDMYLSIQHELINKGLNAGNVVIQFQGDNLDKVMRAYTEARESADRQIYDCSVVNKTGQLINLTATVKSSITPPPLPAKYTNMPPPLPSNVVAKAVPPPLPPPYQKAKQSPEQVNYTSFIQSAQEGIREYLSQRQKGRYKTFANDASFNENVFFLKLLDSANTPFQKAIIIHSLLVNHDPKYSGLKNAVAKMISANPDSQKSADSLKSLGKKEVDALLSSINTLANDKNPAAATEKISQQLKQLDENTPHVAPQTRIK